MNKQQKYQLDHRVRGLCRLCSSPAVAESVYCYKHLVNNRLKMRSVQGYKGDPADNRGRPVKA